MAAKYPTFRPFVFSVVIIWPVLTTFGQTASAPKASERQTSDALSIEGITPDHKIKLLNISRKAISAYTIENLVPKSEWNGFVGSCLLQDPPVQPGESDTSMGIWPEVVKENQVRVAAVIFTDGTHVGHVPDKLCSNKDAVACIFETRQGWADAYTRLAEELNALANTPEALSAFLSKGSRVFSSQEQAPSRATTAHDRALNSTLQMAQLSMQETQAALKSGKLSVTAARDGLNHRWKKAADAMREAATDRGEWH